MTRDAVVVGDKQTKKGGASGSFRGLEAGPPLVPPACARAPQVRIDRNVLGGRGRPP